jgi:hypothetical protein
MRDERSGRRGLLAGDRSPSDSSGRIVAGLRDEEQCLALAVGGLRLCGAPGCITARVARKLGVLTAVCLLALAGAASAAGGGKVRDGGYNPLVKWENAGQTPDAGVIVKDDGKKAFNVGLTCQSAPGGSEGIQGNTLIYVLAPGPVPISGGKFSYSGTITLTSEQDGGASGSPTSTLQMTGKFNTGTLKKN